MQLQTILNRVQRHQSFVYGRVQFRQEEERLALDVTVAARARKFLAVTHSLFDA
jgi:hypothetical protein